MWKVKVTTGWCTPRKKRWCLLRPLGQCGRVWRKLLLPSPHFEPPPQKQSRNTETECYINTVQNVWAEHFDVVFTIESTAWKIQSNVESDYKFPIWSTIEENHKQNPLPICPGIQGDSGGICTTLGNDSMSDSKQKTFIWTWVRFWTVTELWPLETWNRR
jgi:hypothetical protein